jgi:hypothetical protein
MIARFRTFIAARRAGGAGMNVDRVNRWLALAANVGVLAGILLLVFELNQNRQMMRAQTRNDLAMGSMQLLTMPSMSLQLAGVIRRGDAAEELNPDEQLQYRRYVISTFRYYQNAYYQHRMGLYDEDEFLTQTESWRRYVSQAKGTVPIWCGVRSAFPSDFVREMDTNIVGPGAC